MPELPDISLYVTRLRERLIRTTVQRVRVYSPFLLRSVGVSPASLEGAKVEGVDRLGKRILIELDQERFILIHLMIAGRFQWQSPALPEKPSWGKIMLASFRFSGAEEEGVLSLVEASKKKRAALYLLQGTDSLDEHRREGLDVYSCSVAEFTAKLLEKNRTLKRALTDPNAFDGIGNAFSDEILFAAQLSPVRLTGSLASDEIERLLGATRKTLSVWTDRLQNLYPKFPKPSEITAFRPDFAVHGKFGQPCPVCGSPVQRIVYAENETNYCAKCQNEGRLLADRSLSRLLKDDWPKTLEEMVER